MTSKSGQIEVTVTGKAAVVRFRFSEWFMWLIDPSQNLREDLDVLVASDQYSVIVIDFDNSDIHALSGAFHGLLVNLHRRLLKANKELKLCNVPETIMAEFRGNQLVKLLSIYPSLEEALQSDA